MKKFTLAMWVVVSQLVACGVSWGQDHVTLSFLNAQSLSVSNAVGVTNLSYVTGLSNRATLTATNLSGTRVSTGITNNTINWLRTVDIWTTDRNGVPFSTVGNGTNPLTLIVRSSGPATNNLYLLFAPVYGGFQNSVGQSMTHTIATREVEMWSLLLTNLTTTTPTLYSTNIPTHRWPGARSLALLRVGTTNTTDADNGIQIYDIKAVGFRP